MAPDLIGISRMRFTGWISFLLCGGRHPQCDLGNALADATHGSGMRATTATDGYQGLRVWWEAKTQIVLTVLSKVSAHMRVKTLRMRASGQDFAWWLRPLVSR